MTYFKLTENGQTKHQHSANEVNVVTYNKFRTVSPRGHQLREIHVMQLLGEIKTTDQATMISSLSTLETAYAGDGFDAGLYYDDDTVTHMFMASGTSIDGVRVVQFSYPEGDGSQLATRRTFSITLRAEYFQTFGSSLIEWAETLDYRGNGGPRHRIIELQTGAVSQITNSATGSTVRQVGYAVNDDAYQLPNDPLFPAFLRNDLDNKRYRSGKVNMKRVTGYRTEWNYVFQAPFALSGAVPVTR